MPNFRIRVEELNPDDFENVEGAEGFVRKLLNQDKVPVPLIFQIELSDGATLDVGVGSKKGIFLHHIKDENAPYLVTEGSDRHGSIDYYLYGNHHTEILCKHLVGINEATKAIIHFLNTRNPLSELTWVEV